METDEMYDLVVDAVRQALAEEQGGDRVRLSKRMSRGKVIFQDGDGRTVKELPASTLFKKVTAVRERLRVMEQRINNNPGLNDDERAELQGYLTRAYGSLTTFNFLFQEDGDRFRGTGG